LLFGVDSEFSVDSCLAARRRSLTSVRAARLLVKNGAFPVQQQQIEKAVFDSVLPGIGGSPDDAMIKTESKPALTNV